MKRPDKAILLCAGFGTRLRPLTNTTPKAMVPIWGIPILEHNLRLLESWGVHRILVNAHHLPGPMISHLKQRQGAARIALSFEPDILGTGGALARADWFLDEKPFWILNGDVAADLNPLPLLRTRLTRTTVAALWLVPDQGPCTVECRNGIIRTFTSRQPQAPGTFTLAGLHLVSPRVLPHMPGPGFSSIITTYNRAMKAGKRLAGVVVPDAFWADIGTPCQTMDTHARVLQAARDRRPGSRLFAGNPKTFVSAGCSDIPDPDLPRIARHMGWSDERLRIQPLPPRGSNRVLVRLCHGRESAILTRYSRAREENVLAAPHARFLAALGVPVPAVLMDDPDRQFTVTEDMGTRDLADAIRSTDKTRRLQCYRKVLQAVSIMHRDGAARCQASGHPLSPAFTPALYRWEQDLFMTHFFDVHLAHLDHRRQALRREFAVLTRFLARQPRVLVHRDLQSSNILVRHQGIHLIDFQGMRLGPAAYDVASLLCDPYISLPQRDQRSLLAHYCDLTGRDVEQFETAFRYAAVERLLQALGAFGRLSSLPGTERFSRHIRPALAMLQRVLKPVDRLPCLRDTLNVRSLI